MEIYCSKSPNKSPVKRAPRSRHRPSVLSGDAFVPDSPPLLSGQHQDHRVVGVSTSNLPGSAANPDHHPVSTTQPDCKQHHTTSLTSNTSSGMTSPFIDSGINTVSHRRVNGFMNCDHDDDGGFDLESKMTAINEEILAAKLKKIAIEQEKRATNGSHSPSSLIGSQKSSYSDINVRQDYSHRTVERFYVTEGSGSTSPYTNESVEDDDARSSCNSVISHIRTNVDGDEAPICSPRGTVRGNRNRVRASIAAFQAVEEQETPGVAIKPHYPDKERNKIVLYSTTLSIVRETYERCQKVRKVLLTHMVRYEERDLFMNNDMQLELMERLDLDVITVPWVFIHGRLLGDATRIHELNESGDLRMLLRPFPKVTLRVVCEGCGGYRYVPCPLCHGSKKSLLRNHSLQEFRTLKCTNCNENGLVHCEKCLGIED